MLSEQSKQKLKTNIECVGCKKLLNSENATECLECESGICQVCSIGLHQNECPSCSSSEGYRKNLSKLRIEELDSLLFTCPQCKVDQIYSNAKIHISSCI